LNDAKHISIKSAIASAFGIGLPFLLILIVTAITIYCSGVLVHQNKIAPGFVMQARVLLLTYSHLLFTLFFLGWFQFAKKHMIL
jgi:hypothetical protein